MIDKPSTRKISPRPKAVALRYDPDKEAAPVVVGKGTGLLAEKITALAREHGIAIREDADLVEILSLLELHEEIPPATYALVAEILAFIYRANDQYRP